jgi:hypothetical protein
MNPPTQGPAQLEDGRLIHPDSDVLSDLRMDECWCCPYCFGSICAEQPCVCLDCSSFRSD